LFTRRSATTGIDLGQGTITLVRTMMNGSGPVVSHWGLEQFAMGEDASSTAAQALSGLVKRLGLDARGLGRVATAVGGSQAVVRQASLPRLTPEELRRALPFEARKHLPLDAMKQPELDFAALEDSALPEADREESKQAVLLAAVSAGERKQLLRTLAAAGVDPEVIDIHPLPEVNAVLRAHPPAVTEAAATGILSLTDRARVVAAVYPGGELYTRILEGEGGSLDSDDAIQHLVRQLGDTVRFLNTKNRAAPLREFYVCSTPGIPEGVLEMVSTALGMPLILPDPFRGMRFEGEEPGEGDRARLCSAAGLAQWWRGNDV